MRHLEVSRDVVGRRQPYVGLARDVFERAIEILMPERLIDDEGMEAQPHDATALH